MQLKSKGMWAEKMARKKLHSGLILSLHIMNSHCVEFNTRRISVKKKSVMGSLASVKAPLDI